MRSVASSWIAGIDYDPVTRRLTVTKHDGGTIDYHDVEPGDAEAMATTSSPGRFLNTMIRPNQPKTTAAARDGKPTKADWEKVEKAING